MINYKVLNKYIDTLTDADLHEYMKITSQSVVRLSKQKTKAAISELNESSNCSRAKRTSLVAKSYNITNAYNRELETLKHIISRL